jgi:hypothetical protein
MMNYTTVKNPTWTRNGEMIDCVVDFVGIGEVSFTASANDLPHSVEIYNRCVAGDFGPIGDYVPQPDEGPQEPSELPPEMQIPATNTGEVL